MGESGKSKAGVTPMRGSVANAGNFLTEDEITKSDFDAFVDAMIADIEGELRTIPENSGLAVNERAFRYFLESARDRMESDEHANWIQAGFWIGFSLAWTARANAYKGNIKNAQAPRKKRGLRPNSQLRERGLQCVDTEFPGITADQLCQKLDAEHRLNFDDDDVELRLDGDCVVVRNLEEGASPESVTIPINQLGTYLSKARLNT